MTRDQRDDVGAAYARRFDELAAQGRDLHGEARFLDELIAPRSRVLDAGCGTGRVAIRLAQLGHRCLGVDADPSMLAVAQQTPGVPAPGVLAWMLGDLSDLDPDKVTFEGTPARSSFDMVFAAGNVVPLLAPGTLRGVLGRLAGLLAPGAVLVAGFGLDRAHLPAGCPVTPWPEYRDACAAAGLSAVSNFASWDAAPFTSAAGYTVSVHRAS